jgi:hypothetical protein
MGRTGATPGGNLAGAIFGPIAEKLNDFNDSDWGRAAQGIPDEPVLMGAIGSAAAFLGNFRRTERVLQAGDSGAFGDLKAAGEVGDGLTPHHMPQAAAGRTGYNEGGALALPHDEHVLTRTYGARGAAALRADSELSFRSVLAKDIRDIRSFSGPKYNEGLRGLADYYRQNFPQLMSK